MGIKMNGKQRPKRVSIQCWGLKALFDDDNTVKH